MTVLVVGLGKSGLAACALLKRRGERVLATDSAPSPAALAELSEMGVEFTPAFAASDLTVVSPGVPADLPELAGRRVIGELELAFPDFQGPILGITGSNGKTTTTAWVGHILSGAGVPAQVGGNIGIAPAAMVETSRAGQWNVLELSSFQLETTEAFRPDVGACLNVTPNHLDRHHTFEKYAAAKGRMFVGQQAADHKVLNAADAVCRSYAALGEARTHWFNDASAGAAPSLAIQLPGAHNRENAWAASLLARLAGASEAAIEEGLRTFRGVEHRLELVGEVNGVRYINDSKATSVDATLKAIAAVDGPLWIILGGKDKGSDYTPLIGALRGRVREALLIGAAADKIHSQIAEFLPVRKTGYLADAVAEASRRAAPGDTVLLAPACASFDQFRSFEHRGETFKQLVKEIR